MIQQPEFYCLSGYSRKRLPTTLRTDAKSVEESTKRKLSATMDWKKKGRERERERKRERTRGREMVRERETGEGNATAPCEG